MRIRSRAENPCPPRVNSGLVRVTSRAMKASRPRRMSRARLMPVRKACRRWASGRRVTRMEMKTRLSTPSTTSSSTSVPSPIQAEGSAIQARSHMGRLRGRGAQADGQGVCAADGATANRRSASLRCAAGMARPSSSSGRAQRLSVAAVSCGKADCAASASSRPKQCRVRR